MDAAKNHLNNKFMRNLTKVKESIKNIKQVLTPVANTALQKAFEKMPESFSSDWFLEVARTEGLTENAVDEDAHRIFLAFKAKNTNGRMWTKIATEQTIFLPSNTQSTNTQESLFDSYNNGVMPTLSFEEAKAIIEKHGYIVCRKEITITPI